MCITVVNIPFCFNRAGPDTRKGTSLPLRHSSSSMLSFIEGETEAQEQEKGLYKGMVGSLVDAHWELWVVSLGCPGLWGKDHSLSQCVSSLPQKHLPRASIDPERVLPAIITEKLG